MSEVIIYDEDIYEVTSVERSSVENVVWDSNKYIAYVQWGNGRETIYAYNVSKDHWSRFVNEVNRQYSVGGALRAVGWGRHFNTFYGPDTTYSKRQPTISAVESVPDGLTNFEVVIDFTGTITVKVAADDLTGAIKVATSMFDNEATDGKVEILEVKKVN